MGYESRHKLTASPASGVSQVSIIVWVKAGIAFEGLTEEYTTPKLTHVPVGKIYVPKRCCTEGISSFLAVRQRPPSVLFHINILLQHGKLLQQISKTVC